MLGLVENAGREEQASRVIEFAIEWIVIRKTRLDLREVKTTPARSVLKSRSVRNSIVTEGFELPSLERIVRIVQAARFLVDRCRVIRGDGLESDRK